MFTYIGLFAGIGGTKLGFETAGGSCVFIPEYEQFAVHPCAVNHGEVHAGDPAELRLADVPAHSGLVAGFLRRPISNAGVAKLKALGIPNGFDHPNRGRVFFSTRDILAYWRPSALLLE